MLAFLLCSLLPQDADAVVRDEFGVPHIKAATVEQAWYHAGFETARDRLWQMEQSRRLARGTMAEVFGPGFAASDTEVIKTGYTDEELLAQFRALSPKARLMIQAYARGVSDFIKAGQLPPGYQQNGFSPEPWTELDTVAIAVRLFQRFGRGGAGEIRSMALLGYLQGRPETKDRYLDVLDDFAWQNDAAATPTVTAADDPLRSSYIRFYAPDRAATARHVAMLPKVGLLELMPGIRMVLNERSNLVAEKISAPYKWGSYAVVVGPSRSLTGAPLLLSAPQMGHRQPSVLHEMSVNAPGLDVVGVDVPGVPGVIIGKTGTLAWGLTSGVADTDDVIFSKADGADGYTYGTQRLKLETVSRTLKVKGQADRTVVQQRTRFGPVVISNKSWVFSRRAGYWMREMQSFDSVVALYEADSVEEIDKATQSSPMNFNFFWATRTDFGYRYAGAIPVRAPGLDPRLPTPGEPEYDWKGFVPPAQMPHVINPKSGLLANWNNKPSSWWPNFDTPVWGRIFRNTALLEALDKPKLNEQDLEYAAWHIARVDFTYPYFKPFLDPVIADFKRRRFITDPGPVSEAMQALGAFDGRMIAGSQGATVYLAFLDALQEELFLPVTGNFIAMDNFRMVAQPTVVLNALNRKTKVDYLGKRTTSEVIEAAIKKAGERLAEKNGRDLGLWLFSPPSIKWGEEPAVPYSNRGTMIQVIDLAAMSGRNVVPPGVAESGPHSMDQAPLARAWVLKPMKSRSKG